MKHQLTLLLFLLLQVSAFSQKSGYDKAMMKLEMENYDGALADLDKVIEADPSNAEAFFKRGYCHAMLQDHKAALVDFDRAISMKGDNGEWFLERGIAKLNLRDFEGACNDWKMSEQLGLDAAKDYVSEYCP